MRTAVNGIRWIGTCLLAACALALVGSCATTAPPRPVRGEDRPYAWEREGRIPPLDTDRVRREADRQDRFEEVPVETSELSVESVAPPEPVDVTDVTADSAGVEMQGFRVQLFATGSRDSAERMREEAARALGVPAYIDAADGVFKIRVGNCPTRPDAEKLLQRCRSLGYQDAWITASPIRVERVTSP